MSQTFSANLLRIISLACIAVLFITPAHAFTADSLDITIDNSGDAVAIFKFTLEGFLENAIPQSMLEEELKKGLTTSSEPPELISMDKTGTTMRLKKFAVTRDVEQGTEYSTASMNFQKAEIALKNSAISSVVTADFSPATITITFPDGYTRELADTAVLPSLTHIVIDPSRPSGPVIPDKKGSINITASPEIVHVSIDGTYTGDSPHIFSDIPSGTHTVLFRKEGFQPVTKNITVVDGRTTNVFVFLQQNAQPPAAPSGLLPIPGFGIAILCLAVGSAVMMRRIIRQ